MTAQDYKRLLRSDAAWEVGIGASTEFCGWSGAVNFVINSYSVQYGEEYANLGVSSILEFDSAPPWCGPYYVSSVVNPTTLWLREDTVIRHVYQLDMDSGTDRLLYDFTAQVGDTLPDYFDEDPFGELTTVVVSIDSAQLSDGMLHRRWNLITFTEDGLILDEHFYIEGVGSRYGILHNGPFVYGWGPLMWCYKRNISSFLYTSYGCHLPSSVSIQAHGTDPPVQITNGLGGRFDYDVGLTSGELVIHAVDGRVLHRASVIGRGTVPSYGHPPGAYVYTFQDLAGRRWTGRIITE